MCAACDAGCVSSAPLTSSSGAEHAFDFDGLMEINSRESFIESLPMLSASSKNFFALSSRYFDTKTFGAVQLMGDLTSFAQSEELGGIDLSIQTPSNSFTSWVKTTKNFAGGYILRKRLSQTSDLSCWGWYLNPRCCVCACIHLRLCACVRQQRACFATKCLSSASISK